MTKHTDGEFTICRELEITGFEKDKIEVSDPDHTVITVSHLHGKAKAEKVAAELVKRWNLYAELVAAVKEGKECLAGWMEIADEGDRRAYDQEALDRMNAVLEKAGAL